MKYFNHLLIIISAISVIACNRAKEEEIVPSGHVQIQIPKNLSSQKVGSLAWSITTGAVECFGVSVTGPGISETPRACGPTTGLVAGLVAAGGTLSLEVPNGPDRTFTVYMYLAPAGTACEHWDASFSDSYGAEYRDTFKVGEVTGVNITQDTAVNISITPPANLATDNVQAQLGITAACSPAISAMLLTNGDIVARDGSIISAESSEILESFTSFTFQNFGGSSIVTMNSGGKALYQGVEYDVPPFIRSLITHPFLPNTVVGLTEGGNLWLMNVSTSMVTEYTPGVTGCGFDTCSVPIWMSSITLGRGGKLFGLDHSGQFYKLTNSDPIPIVSESFSEAVVQVAF